MEDTEILIAAKAIIKDIGIQRRSIEADERECITTYKERMKTLEARRFILKNICPHIDTSYYPDGSGNGGSRECNLCGKGW